MKNICLYIIFKKDVKGCEIMKKYFFILKCHDEIICVSLKRKQIVYYLAQKENWKFHNLFTVERCRKKTLGLYEDFLLQEHWTGYLFTPEELNQFEYEKERYQEMYVDTVECLKTISAVSKDEKEIKRLNKALKIVEKYKDFFIGRKAEKRIAESIATTKVEDICQERELYRLFYEKCQND